MQMLTSIIAFSVIVVYEGSSKYNYIVSVCPALLLPLHEPALNADPPCPCCLHRAPVVPTHRCSLA